MGQEGNIIEGKGTDKYRGRQQEVREETKRQREREVREGKGRR